MIHRRVALTFVFGSCFAVVTARAQTALREWRGATQGDGLSSGLANLGDVDQDGVNDFAIGVPGDDTVGSDRGQVVVRSGADGHEIRTFHGAHYDMRFGTSVHGLGDVNLDGTPDLIVGSSGAAAYGSAAYAIHYAALSGIDGTTVWEFAPPPGTGSLGSVARLGDTNSDGRSDVVISMPGQGTPSHAGVIVVLSGLDGSILQQVTGPVTDSYIGLSVSAAGDLDGDGRADWWNSRNLNFFYNKAQARSGLDGHLLAEIDLPYHYESDYYVHLVGGNDVNGDGVPDLVAAVAVTPGYGLHGPGHVLAYSGANQSVLWTRYGESDLLRIGWWLADVGDLDGDGVHDIGTSVGYGVPYSGYADSRAKFLSGASGIPFGGLLTLPPPELSFTRVFAAGDVDGDGHGDILYGALNYTGISGQQVPSIGVARVVTLAREGLKADRFDLDHELGGTQTLTLDFGPAYAGRSYRVLGSQSGTGPGLTTSAGVVPLAVDPYFMSTLRTPGDLHLAAASGSLDAQGRATASFTLPPESGRFVRDTVVHHAAVVLDAMGASIAAVSRAVPLLVTVDACHADPSAIDDCDGNGMRDGCQVNIAGTADCNHNARPDACDLAGGGSLDCDGDQLPDECTDYWHDVNQNNVPDTCEVKTIYVDDDALNDPGPGNPTVSDPLANGSLQRPFDSLRKAMVVATPLDTIVMEDGLYAGDENKGQYVFGRVRALRSRNGPDQCVIDAGNYGAVIVNWNNSTFPTDLVGITIQHTGIFSTGYGSFPNNGSSSGDILIKNCRFLDGASDKNPGLQIGVYAGASLVIENCVFARNFSGPQGTDGFALEVTSLGGACTLRNCLFADDFSVTGKIPVAIGADVVIDHCTFFGQSGGTQAVLKFASGTAGGTSFSLSNSILWTDGSSPVLTINGHGSANYVLAKGGASALATQFLSGVGILDMNPQFVHAAGEDFHILSTSPCVDAGDPAFISVPGEVDGDGDPRVLNGRTDIGWDEQH